MIVTATRRSISAQQFCCWTGWWIDEQIRHRMIVGRRTKFTPYGFRIFSSIHCFIIFFMFRFKLILYWFQMEFVNLIVLSIILRFTSIRLQNNKSRNICNKNTEIQLNEFFFYTFFNSFVKLLFRFQSKLLEIEQFRDVLCCVLSEFNRNWFGLPKTEAVRVRKIANKFDLKVDAQLLPCAMP